MIKLVADGDRGVLVGGTAVGPSGGEVLGLIAAAVHAEIPVATLRGMHFAYPTFHRAIETALGDLLTATRVTYAPSSVKVRGRTRAEGVRACSTEIPMSHDQPTASRPTGRTRTAPNPQGEPATAGTVEPDTSERLYTSEEFAAYSDAR